MTGFDIELIAIQRRQPSGAEAEHLPAHPSQPAVIIPSQGLDNVLPQGRTRIAS